MSGLESLDRTEPYRSDVHAACVAFYNREAELLDDKELERWLELLTDDVRYDMPVRVTREKNAEQSQFSEGGYHYREDRSTLEARVERFQSEYAWSEDPPSRTRHHVSNVRIEEIDGEEVHTKTNLLLFRAQGDGDDTVFSAERHDTLRAVDGELKLADRLILLDHTVFPSKNITVFF